MHVPMCVKQQEGPSTSVPSSTESPVTDKVCVCVCVCVGIGVAKTLHSQGLGQRHTKVLHVVVCCRSQDGSWTNGVDTNVVL